MATTPEYNEFVCERLEPFGAVRSRKMFGEYMVYLNAVSYTQLDVYKRQACIRQPLSCRQA